MPCVGSLFLLYERGPPNLSPSGTLGEVSRDEYRKGFERTLKRVSS